MGKLLAGASLKTITPNKDLLKKIVQEDNRHLTGIYEDIYVRVIVLSSGLQRLAIITVDLNRFPAQEHMRNILTSKYGIERLGCIFGCTRNHQAASETVAEENLPSLDAPVKIGPAREEYIKFVHNRTCDAVDNAIKNLCPAKIGIGTGQSFINACRNWPTPAGVLEAPGLNEITNHLLTVLRVADLNNNTIALLSNYAMHGAFFCDPSFELLGSDITGAISRYVETYGQNKYPVLWAAGGGGDQNIIISAKVEYCDLNKDGNFERKTDILPLESAVLIMKRLAATQGLDIINTANDIIEYKETFTFWGGETSLSLPAKRPYKSLPAVSDSAGCMPALVPLDEPMHLKLHLTILNHIAFVGISGEICTRHCKKLREILYDKTVIFMDMSYGHCGCIPDPEIEKMNGYPGMSTFFRSSEEVTQAIYDSYTRMYEEYRSSLD